MKPMKKRLTILSALALGLFTAKAQEAVTISVLEEESASPEIAVMEYSGDDQTTEVISVRRTADQDCDDSYATDTYSENDWMNAFSVINSGGSGRTAKRWKWSSGHWAGIGINYSGLVKNLGHLRLPDGAKYMKQTAGSIGVNLQLVDFTLVSKRSFGLITGLGLEFNNFKFDRDISLTQDQNGVIVEDTYYMDNGIGLSKSKLSTMYLNIPLLVEFQIGRPRSGWKRPGFINFGMIAGVRLEGHTKIKSSDPRVDGIYKKTSGLNLRNFHWGTEFNIGYKGIALSARYYPHSIFTKDEGPNVQQANIGVSYLF